MTGETAAETERGSGNTYYLFRARVARVVDVGPRMRRITVTGPGLAQLPDKGPDQRVKLLLGEGVPDTEGPFSMARFLRLMVTSKFGGPTIRTYTVRHHRAGAAELDIDFALHDGHIGPGTQWALDAAPGDEVGVYGTACEYKRADDAWQLLIADETALPAVSAILERLPRDARGVALVETAHAEDVLELRAPAGVSVQWLSREGEPGHLSSLLLDAVTALELPDGQRTVWIGAEASVTTSIRRHLVKERGVDKGEVHFSGYWKYGRAIG